ncbi:adenosine 3'-phospho 5'-phosphosulfate transporter 1 [Lepeophtheirus salmonis]|uniref:adenosine 3'-phospho 5'-phosphosulfate transporter 1 n=1 Tax=Lepeophtheirus salmonis TaxID=72036 RepID=UPI001AE6225C|nr:adenosine 3'-phospho 5'-phosphosulfate transporter 1-like [Lepeophtheirus salmonis]XP_040574707.1 adenosine 3'-phospho 5'-phosphosulfate transporter 1-like [Lepeophtheirus salmonis]
MATKSWNVRIGLVLGLSFLLALCIRGLSSSFMGGNNFWIYRLLENLSAYQLFLFPGGVLLLYLRKVHYFENSGNVNARLHKCLQIIFVGIKDLLPTQEGSKSSSPSSKTPVSQKSKIITLLYCVVGLQVSYLTWGYLQERIMTRDYYDSTGKMKRFSDSQFLVFVNRILGFSLAILYLAFHSRGNPSGAPVYKYSYCSFTNIMSSWCQYEALKFVSFPTQVLSKACKVIPVMIMGRIVSNKKYEYYEYVVACMLSFGMILFLFGTPSNGKETSANTTVSGAILLIAYMAFDAFTSNWQGELFTSYKMNSIEMMGGVNFFSCLLTSTSLLSQGAFYDSLVFMSQFPSFAFDCVVLSVCSATGQLFIYHTISQFGPLIFAIIMTLRQSLAILISCFVFKHPLNSLGIVGILIVFSAIFVKIYCGHRLRQLKKQAATIQRTT